MLGLRVLVELLSEVGVALVPFLYALRRDPLVLGSVLAVLYLIVSTLFKGSLTDRPLEVLDLLDNAHIDVVVLKLRLGPSLAMPPHFLLRNVLLVELAFRRSFRRILDSRIQRRNAPDVLEVVLPQTVGFLVGQLLHSRLRLLHAFRLPHLLSRLVIRKGLINALGMLVTRRRDLPLRVLGYAFSFLLREIILHRRLLLNQGVIEVLFSPQFREPVVHGLVGLEVLDSLVE